MSEGLDGFAGIVVESLRFEEDGVAGFVPESVIFRFFPVEMVDFGIKIEQKEAEVMTGEVVFWAGVAEADDKIHKTIVQYIDFWRKV